MTYSQVLFVEKILPKRYYEVCEEVRLKKFIIQTDFELIDLNHMPVCEIRNGAFAYPLFQISFLNNMILNIIYCISKGYAPVVKFVSPEGINLWEQFLEQPVEVLNTNDLIVCDVSIPKISIPMNPNKSDIDLYHRIYRRFVRLNDSTREYIQRECDEILKGKRVVGCLCRGTDYVLTKPKDHPIQPRVNDVIAKLKEFMLIYNCEYIYLATEEQRIAELFIEVFPGRVLVNKRKYYDSYYDLAENYGADARISWVHNNRDADNYYKSLEYFSSIHILSRCQGLIGGGCGGTQAALILNGNNYEFTFIFDLGKY